MKGRKPKRPEVRQRRNKTVTAKTLKASSDGPTTAAAAPAAGPKRAPSLPGGTMWHKQTKSWWKRAWSSPMAEEWLPSDWDVMYMIAVLRNDFYLKPSASLAAEIRQQEARLGLSPMDRLRLQWKIAPDEKKPTPPPTAREMLDQGKDPREALRAV